MRNFLDHNSKLFSLLNKLTLLMELNILVLLCCLPVVTAGAALSSMHNVLLKIYRDEEKRVVPDFFQAMKSNLKNGTILWLLFLGYMGVLLGCYVMVASWASDEGTYLVFGLLLAAIAGIVYWNWARILQSRYDYTIGQCLKNALLAWIKYPGAVFVFLVSAIIPILLCCSFWSLPLVLMVGITLPQMMSTFLYNRVFDEMEGIPIHLPKL